jgi:hypothetical protein
MGQLGHQNTQAGAVQPVNDPRPEVATPFDYRRTILERSFSIHGDHYIIAVERQQCG